VNGDASSGAGLLNDRERSSLAHVIRSSIIDRALQAEEFRLYVEDNGTFSRVLPREGPGSQETTCDGGFVAFFRFISGHDVRRFGRRSKKCAHAIQTAIQTVAVQLAASDRAGEVLGSTGDINTPSQSGLVAGAI